MFFSYQLAETSENELDDKTISGIQRMNRCRLVFFFASLGDPLTFHYVGSPAIKHFV